jgi:hypothetical protein
MSVTSDIRAYADSAINTAVKTGKQTLTAAQEQFGGVTISANEFVGDLRNSAEKVVNVDAVRTAIEPYLTQLRGYGDEVGDRVEEIVATLKKDPRFGKLVETADSLSSVVLEIIQERVVKPVQSLTGSAKPRTAHKPSPKPAATRPARKPAATTSSSTRRPAAKTTARKAPAKRTTTSANGTAKA